MLLFSKKYRLQSFVLSSVLICRPLTHTIIQTLNGGVSGVDELSIHGVIINSVCCVESPGMGGSHSSSEGTRGERVRVHWTSVVEHCLLSGDFSVGRRAVVSHVTGTHLPTHPLINVNICPANTPSQDVERWFQCDMKKPPLSLLARPYSYTLYPCQSTHVPGCVGRDLCVEEGITLQYVPLQSLDDGDDDDDGSECLRYVLLLFSIDDNIKLGTDPSPHCSD